MSVNLRKLRETYDEQRRRFIEQEGYGGAGYWQVSACR